MKIFNQSNKNYTAQNSEKTNRHFSSELMSNEQFKYLKTKHSFHLVDPSPWPLVASLSAFFMTSGGVLYMHKFAAIYSSLTKYYSYILAPKNLYIGHIVKAGSNAEPKLGHSLSISKIPVGSFIHNVSVKSNEKSQLARAAGTFCQLIEKTSKQGRIRLSSGEQRLLSINCIATLSIVSNDFSFLTTLGKDGRARWLNKRPKVRGVAINPIDHPHGGGEGKASGGRTSVSPWGKPTKVGKTSKSTNTLIVVKRAYYNSQNQNANFAAVYSSLTTKRLKIPALGHCTRKRFYSVSAPCRMPLPFSYRPTINPPFQNTVPTPPSTPVEVQTAVVGTPQSVNSTIGSISPLTDNAIGSIPPITDNTPLTVDSTIGSISPLTDPSNAIPHHYLHDHGFGPGDYSDVVTQVIYNYSNTFTPSEMDTLIYLTVSYL